MLILGIKLDVGTPKCRSIFIRNGVHIIDLVKTALCMNNAYKWTRNAAKSGKRFLFVGTKKQAGCCGSRGSQMWCCIRKSKVARRNAYELDYDEGKNRKIERPREWKVVIAIAMRPKKEAAVLRELERLQKYLGGLKGMRRLPDVVVLVDQRRESNAVLEARKLDISLVSMLDTNYDPDLCEVPIPCNDDAVRSVQLILGRLADAINEGRKGSNEQRKKLNSTSKINKILTFYMGNITAKLVKDLRDKTGAGMMDCKKALNETEGNVEKALEWLRKKGIASAEKKSEELLRKVHRQLYSYGLKSWSPFRTKL